MEKIKAEVDKDMFCTLNFDSLFAMNPKLLGRPNTKGGQEMQQEGCKGKTIVEVLNIERKNKDM